MLKNLRYLLVLGLFLYICCVITILSVLRVNPYTDDYKTGVIHQHEKHLVDVTTSRNFSSTRRVDSSKQNSEYHVDDSKQNSEYHVDDTEYDSPDDSRRISKLNSNFVRISHRHFVYSAFADSRKNVSYIRLIAIGPGNYHKTASGFFCRFGRTQQEQYRTELIYYETCESHIMPFSFYIMSCPIPKEVEEDYLSAEVNNITIENPNANKHQFSGITLPFLNNMMKTAITDFKMALCVPPLFGELNVLRFVEFIELSRLLGSNHFIFYATELPPAIKTVLRFYERIGLATVLPWKLPVENEVWYKGQSAAISDCLFRSMFRYNLVAFNDIDEFIIPRKNDNWEEMIENIHANSNRSPDEVAVYRFMSAYFEPSEARTKHSEFPQNFNLFVSQNNTKRTTDVSNIRTKMLVNPQKVFELGIHHLSKPIDDVFVNLNVDSELALLHHYRKCETNYGMNCENFKEDTMALKYMHSLISHTEHTLKQIHNNYKPNETSEFKKVKDMFSFV